MRKLAAVTVTAMLLGGGASLALAQTQSTRDPMPENAPSMLPVAPTDKATDPTPTIPEMKSQSVPDVVTPSVPSEREPIAFGTPLFDSEGEEIGTVDRPAISASASEGIVANVGGFLGMGEREVLLTRDQLTKREGEPGYRVTLTEDQIGELPDYEEAPVKTPESTQ